MEAGYDVAEKPVARAEPTTFNENFRPELLKKLNQVSDNVSRKNFTLLDARDAKRFEAGHIPNSRSVPYLDLLNPDGTLKPKDQLEKIFQEAGADLQKPLACTCGSGITACVIALALFELGYKDAAVYDGSWTEWSSKPALPKAQGAEK
jgi:thiosulfate/3-mercaptopyruvate sulfurtransferase